jgi:hypothetical protein
MLRKRHEAEEDFPYHVGEYPQMEHTSPGVIWFNAPMRAKELSPEFHLYDWEAML